ncbi:DEAD/DEAH box helicase [Actinoplanes sp. NPDC023936]|uniref:DEAD/DEAH box helicase n=1 Tax=Actinoplanes sp. NPDC023936 TaxID=3154910 RepID=UPI0033CC15E4
MRPTLAAESLRHTLTQYLTTTFALADTGVREALAGFLNHPEQGIFRGPYLRVRMPFRKVSKRWRSPLTWLPADFSPYDHQAKAFGRLSTVTGPARPTLVTTGTGSGKTESFLYPILDHCRRARQDGQAGVKAVLLYPMNALATDQTLRLKELLAEEPALAAVTAGLYIGDVAEMSQAPVMTSRYEIRDNPPDILITNYKMLDLLLQRSEDKKLWEDANLAFVVLDEFHTYDGAQGTDVAMLLRRLAAVTGQARPGQPLGDICPVATSATLGNGGPGDTTGKLREVAAQVFGTEFDENAVIGESRAAADDVLKEIDFGFPLPEPAELAAFPDPSRDPTAMRAIAQAVLGNDDLTPVKLGAGLRKHILTQAVLRVLGDRPQTFAEILELVPREGAYSWGRAFRVEPEVAATALARFVALLSMARRPEAPDLPLLAVETHMWVRVVSRLLRAVATRPAFGWSGELPRGAETETSDADSVVADRRYSLLPAIYCRHCGRSGWSAISPERDPEELIGEPEKIYRASVGRDKRRVRALIAATGEEIQGGSGEGLLVLEASGVRIRPFNPGADRAGVPDGGVVVLGDLYRDRDAETDRCPACGLDDGIRFLGAGLASLASVAVTQLFTGGELVDNERKTLLFNDSVQDAAHRAGFVANRSYNFSLRALLVNQLTSGVPTRLNDVIADVIQAASDPATLAAVVPPDLHDDPGVDALLSGGMADRDTWRLIGERLAFATIMDVGLRSRQGRTLELTRTAAVEVVIDDLPKVVGLCRDVLLGGSQLTLDSLPDDAVLATMVRGLLERLRIRGGVRHTWLEPFVHQGGRRWQVWGGRPDGMPAFPHGKSAPAFAMTAPKGRNSEFDVLSAANNWYEDWVMRCLRLSRAEANRYLQQLLAVLAREGVLASRTIVDGSTVVYGLQPGHINLVRLSDAEAADAGVRCDSCAWEQTVPPARVSDWVGQRCLRYRCVGRFVAARDENAAGDYYRRLYLGGGVFRVVTAEHTGMLTRAQREGVEAAFRREKQRYTDPNVLACTPTLELGINIGDLSAVILGSLPRGPANYVQRAGRAGRTSGNSLVLTFVGRRERDRYYLNEPRDMIAGQIRPPGCYLSAIALLRRQYLAYLIDLAARDRLTDVAPMPRHASVLFGDTGWLNDLVNTAIAEGDRLVADFLDLFAGGVSEGAASELKSFATDGIAAAIAEFVVSWEERIAGLRRRKDAINAAMGGLIASDPSQARELRGLRAERKAVGDRLGEIGGASAHSTMVEFGLLPNYSLIDSRTLLDATLTWENSTEDGDRRFGGELREYSRPARTALVELAPGNTYYVRGYRHTIDGLEIGRPDRPLYERWRICPSCGYVRTSNAVADTSACLRCRTPAIADAGCLHYVLRPTVVRSRDRREDARIRDDTDERTQRRYTTTFAADIPTVENPWRHDKVTFGVDYTRHAKIREFNLGAARFDRPATDPFAGDTVRLNPFYACMDCGGTTADGPPPTATNLPGSDPVSGAGPAPTGDVPGTKHHQPWCRHRRSPYTAKHTPLLLVHELETEALRILIPAATALVDERVVSFAAALMLGITVKYGGEPDHLRVVRAPMADRDSDNVRQFLVVYDTQPSGTGYLHRLSADGEFKEVLETAVEAITTCECNREGRKACHRCLLRFARDDEFPLMSRDEALEILRQLLDDWKISTDVGPADEISLTPLVESELERKFLHKLIAWAEQDPSVRLTRRADMEGARFADLRLEAPDGRVVHWRMKLQNTITGTRPDVHFKRLDAAAQEVAVYLDGYQYHASPPPGRNRLADDTMKRTRLRAHDLHVFALTWDDVRSWRNTEIRHDAVWPPYQGLAQQAARDLYRQRTGNDPQQLNDLVWANPIDLLLQFLRDPDLDLWRSRAEATLAGLLRQPDNQRVSSDSTGITARVTAAVHGQPLPAPVSGGRIVVARADDANGCPLVLILDQRADPRRPVWSAFTVIDDRAATLSADPRHKRRWAAWLWWGNIIQFLADGDGDAAQLAKTILGTFDPTLLYAAEGTGLIAAHRPAPLDDETATWLGRSTEPAPAVTSPSDEPDSAWQRVVELADLEESGVESLLRGLIQRHVPAPVSGYELNDAGWQADFAWPRLRIAVVQRLHGPAAEIEEQDRDAAFAAEGWHVRPAKEWDVDELATLVNEGEE